MMPSLARIQFQREHMRARSEDDAEDEADLKVIRDVREHGWHVVAIPPEAGTPGWVFSIGIFQTLRHPEIVVFGLDQNVAHFVVNEIGARIRSGKRFQHGSEAGGLLEGVRCTFRDILINWYEPFLGTAMWYYRGTDFPAIQCIWPDHEQHYPWEPQFQKNWKWAQPLLFERTPQVARAVDLLRSMDIDIDRADEPSN